MPSFACPLHFNTYGDPAGQPVLCLHGLSDSSFSFSRLVPHLPEHWFVILADLRGHGESPKPPAGYTIESMAEDARMLLQTLGVRRAMLVGHSLGSMVAQCLAARHPGLVECLALVGAIADASIPLVQQLAEAIDAMPEGVDASFIREFQQSAISRPVPEPFFEKVVQESQRVPRFVWKGILDELLESGNSRRFGPIQTPALLVWGAQDAFFGEEQQLELKRRLPGSLLQVLPDVGHSPQWEEPEVCAQLLIEWRRAASGPATPTRAESR